MTTIQEAIQAAAPGDIVVIPAGVYDVSNLVLPSNITLQADGNVTIVGNLIVNGSNTVVQGFTFDGGFVDLWSSQGATVRDCVFNGGQASVKFTDADGALITNNNFNNVTGNVLDGWGLNQSTISGNHFSNCWQCINLDFNNDATRGNNVVIDHNTFINTARMPIEVGPGETARTSNLVISNNWSDNSHVTNQASDGAVAYSIISTYGDHTLIEGNYAKGPSGPGIGIELAGSGEIANNSIDTFEFGIIVYSSGFNVHDNATVNTPIESVLNYSGGDGIIQNNTTDATSFSAPPPPPDTSAISSGTTTLADTTIPTVASETDAAGDTGSAPLTFALGTTAPVLTVGLGNDTGASVTDKITSNPTLIGTADPNAVLHFTVDNSAIAATATASSTGAWSFTPTGLADGSHAIVASETNAAGVTETRLFTFILDTHCPIPTFSGGTLSSGQVTLKGSTGEANESISIYDGNSWLGFATTGTDGRFSFTGAADPSVTHSYGMNATDVAGNEGHGGGNVILGTSNADTLTGSTGNDIIAGKGGYDRIIGGAGADKLSGGAGKDTFVYNAASDSNASGSDVISDFRHGTDKLDFTNIVGISASKGLPIFQGNITGAGDLTLNAHSVAYLEVGGNTIVLVNTSSAAETVATSDTHAADMSITMLGVHLGLTRSDFHHV